MFKPPAGFSRVQRVSWYVGLGIAALGTLTIIAIVFRVLVFVWQWILGVS